MRTTWSASKEHEHSGLPSVTNAADLVWYMKDSRPVSEWTNDFYALYKVETSDSNHDIVADSHDDIVSKLQLIWGWGPHRNNEGARIIWNIATVHKLLDERGK